MASRTAVCDCVSPSKFDGLEPQRLGCPARADRMQREQPPCTIYSGQRVPGDDEAGGLGLTE